MEVLLVNNTIIVQLQSVPDQDLGVPGSFEKMRPPKIQLGGLGRN